MPIYADIYRYIPQVEKDNACDRVDASEEQCKAARV